MTSFNSLIKARPGVQLSSELLDFTPEPLPNHAIAYMFVAVSGNSTPSPEFFSFLVPNVPTIVTSVNDYLEKIGGKIPSPVTDPEPYDSYRSVEAFFENNSGNGVLYVIRVAPVSYVSLNLNPENTYSTSQYFALKIDGVYFGDIETNIEDSQGDLIYAIKTTGNGASDNAYDVLEYLSNNNLFLAAYEVIESETDVLQGVIKIKSKLQQAIDCELYISNALTNLISSLQSVSNAVAYAKQTTDLYFKIPYVTDPYVIDIQKFNDLYYTALFEDDFLYFPTSAQLTNSELTYLINKYLVAENVLIDDPSGYGYTTDSLENLIINRNFVVIPENDNATIEAVTSGNSVTRQSLSTKISFYSPTFDLVNREITAWTPISIPFTSFNLTPVVSYSLNFDQPGNRFVLTANGDDSNPRTYAESLLPKVVSAINDPNYDVVVNEGLEFGFQTALGVAKNASILIPEVLDENLNSWDSIATLVVTSDLGVPKYIWHGTKSNGTTEKNFFRFDSNSELINDYQATINAIKNSFDSESYLPGYLLAPYAYKNFAKSDNLKVSAALLSLARRKNWLAVIDESSSNIAATNAYQEYRNIVSSVGASGGYGTFYYPYVKNTNDEFFPVSPFLVGMAMNRIGQQGFNQPPGGTDFPLNGVLDVKYKVSESHQETYSPIGMNPVLKIINKGICVFGARTFDTGSPVQFINSRVVGNVLLYVLQNSFDQFVFDALESDNLAIFGNIRLVATAIMQDLYNLGGLIGDTPLDAYQVICDRSNNSDQTLAQGVVYLYVEARLVSTLERLAIKLDLTNGTIQIS